MKIVRVARARERRDNEGNVKPPLVCELDSTHVITPGTPYKHVKLHMRAPKHVRCADCPDWRIWDISSSMSARLEQIAFDFDTAIQSAENPDDVQSALEEAANAVREIAEEKRDGAQNIEDGFGHPTQQSDELVETADTLASWADEIEAAEVPDLPEPEDVDCETCSGTGITDVADQPCGDCDRGKVIADGLSEDELDEWRSTVADDVGIVHDCPV